MTAKQFREQYSPLFVDYINKSNKWLTTNEICVAFNLNPMQVVPLLNILCNKYYIKKKIQKGSPYWGKLTLK